MGVENHLLTHAEHSIVVTRHFLGVLREVLRDGASSRRFQVDAGGFVLSMIGVGTALSVDRGHNRVLRGLAAVGAGVLAVTSAMDAAVASEQAYEHPRR